MQIESYLFFNGDCEDALNFYAQALGGQVTALMRYEGSPMDNAELPANWKQKIMHANFEAEGSKFMASDGMPGQPRQPTAASRCRSTSRTTWRRHARPSTRWPIPT